MKKVYLAGPISGLDYNTATEWRLHASKILEECGITAYSPMRKKEMLKDEKDLNDTYNKIPETSQDFINIRDFNDCKTSDGLLVNLLGTKRVSIGTVMEIAWARAFKIPTVIVLEKDNIHNHGMLVYGALTTDSLDHGTYLINILLNP